MAQRLSGVVNRSRIVRRCLLLPVLAAFGFTSLSSSAAEIDDCRASLLTGKYLEVLAQAGEAIDKGGYGEDWPLLKAEAHLAVGQYRAALQTVKAALERYNWSVRLRWLGIAAARFSGETALADSYADEIARLVRSTPWRYTDPNNLVVLGEYALEQGLDAKAVQEAFFQRAKRNNPLHREPALAIGRLALEKHDFQLAAEAFRDALEEHPDDPDLLFGLGAALSGSDREAAVKNVDAALERNPHHFRAQLWKVDRLIEAEQYAGAIERLDQVLEVNPLHPEALAFRAAIALVQGDHEGQSQFRDRALSTWAMNPAVDHIIGRELSQKYRFKEGAQFQRLALAMDEDFLPARKQLAEDLLRLGNEQEGWRLAEQAYAADQYDVAMYNLVMLKDELEKFATIEDEHFRIRMDAAEASIYGQRVLRLLNEARTTLCAKYGVELTQPTLVEIFPRPNDFAVRTFGMPGAEGFLGVCFGNVITANSPASQQASPSNWESVLWHEFTHVVTLNATLNRMPRWLSEGISVYEERQRNPSWGERMNPQYREMILSDETLTPVGKLSGAFLAPKSALHLQFAYYESSLVVEFLIDSFGFDALRSILVDLALGMYINDALDRHTEPLPELEEHFVEYARAKARAYGSGVDWSDPELKEVLESAVPAVAILKWIEDHPTNYRGLKQCAQYFIRTQNWEQAQAVLERALELFPHEVGETAPALLLAEVSRRQGDPQRERELLYEYAQRAPEAVQAYRRLIEIETERQNWPGVRDAAAMHLAVNPLAPQPHSALALAAEKLGRPSEAAGALESLLELNPVDSAGIYYRLARQRSELGQAELAKRHVLQALEQAPRYRDALKLLLQLRADAPESGGRDGHPPPPSRPEPIPADGSVRGK